MEKLFQNIKKLNLKHFVFSNNEFPFGHFLYFIDGYIFIYTKRFLIMFKDALNYNIHNRKLSVEQLDVLLYQSSYEIEIINNSIYNHNYAPIPFPTLELNVNTDSSVIEFSKFIIDKKKWMWHPDRQLDMEFLGLLKLKKQYTTEDIYEVNNIFSEKSLTIYMKNERNYHPILVFNNNFRPLI